MTSKIKIHTPPSRQEAEAAVRTLIRWAGDDPEREGLIDTPTRVINAYQEFFCGYKEDPKEILARTFEEVGGYQEIILLRNIQFESHCEHHMVPIIGKAHVAYLPDKRVVGISKLARMVNIFSKRLQIQERLTAEIANTIQEVLTPQGVAVIIEASHECMSTRGIHDPDVSMTTSRFLGVFQRDHTARMELFSLLNRQNPGL